MTDTTCPEIVRLLRFLDGPSPEVDDEAVVAHVEECAACRAGLERLAAATELPALRGARSGRETAADMSYLRRLKEMDLGRPGDSAASRPLGDAPPPELADYE